MKIDSHQHFWKYNPIDYGWIGDNMSILKRDFLPSGLKPELDGLNFDGCIAVQARQSLEETRWLLQLAQANSFINGVVGWVDLCSSNIENQLEEFSKNKKLVGVRHVVHDEADDKFMARKDFQNGISLLSNYNLTYDLLLFPKHIPLASELIAKFAAQKFVLDHIGKPLIKDQKYVPWEKEIISLAKNKNVYCKLSGMVTESDWNNWKPADFKYYLDVVFNCFGADRLMIGSDWPVCKVAGSYGAIMSIVIDYIVKLDKETQEKILGDNCRRFYLEKS